MSTDDIMDRLAAANPVRANDLYASPEQRQATRRQITARLDEPAPRPAARANRRKLATSLIAVALALFILSGGVTIARDPSFNSSVMGLLMLNNNQIPEEIAQAKRMTPLPPGAAWDPINYDTEGTIYEVGVFTGMVQAQAECKWFAYWQDARRRGDEAATAQALNVIRETPNWASWRDYTVPESRQSYIGLIEQAVQGDPSGIDNFATVNCESSAGQ